MKLGLAALQRVGRTADQDTPRLLDALAAASAAVVKDMSGEDGGSEIAAVTDSLKALLVAQGAEGDRPSAEEAGGGAPLASQTSASTTSLDSDPELTRDFIAESCDRITDVSGRGVGMDVVKRSVDSLRGKIEVRSVKGEGTTFTLRLPLPLAIAHSSTASSQQP